MSMDRLYLSTDDTTPITVPRITDWSFDHLPTTSVTLEGAWYSMDEPVPLGARTFVVGDERFVSAMQLLPDGTIDVTLTQEAARALLRGMRQLQARAILACLSRMTRPRQRKDYLRRLHRRYGLT